MSGFPILDLVIGLFFIFFLLSIISSSIVEIVLTVTMVRAKILGEWLLRIFDTEITDAKGIKTPLGQVIMNHCALTALSPTNKAPSYIDAKNFVSALLDKIFTFSTISGPKSIDEIISSISSSTALSDELRRTFLIYATEAKDTFKAMTVKTTGAIELFRSKMENWYDSNMNSLTGTLKQQYTRRFTLLTGVIVCIALNADTIEIAKYLYNNPQARASLAIKADAAIKDSTYIKQVANINKLATTVKDTATKQKLEVSAQQLVKTLNEKVADISATKAVLQDSLPLGWNASEFNLQGWDIIFFVLSKLIGLSVTVAAIMMGAPFWFDVLNKISNVRGAGAKPKQSDK